MNVPSRERLFDLAADRALVGLDPAEDEELAHLLVAFPDADTLAREVELAAAAIAVAGAADQGMLQMPARMVARLEELAEATMPTTIHRGPDLLAAAAKHAAAAGSSPPKALKQTAHMPWQQSGQSFTGPVQPQQQPQQPQPMAQPMSGYPAPSYPQPPISRPQMQEPMAPVIPLQPRASSAGRVVALTGWMAAAACLLLAVGAWYFRPRTQIVTVNVPTPPPSVAPTASAPPQLTPQQERDSLLARAGTARLEWSKNAKDPASKQASGDVVWNAAEQKGFMRFQGLAKNDKRANVYQLWIFDKSRDDKYPVDGGVFTIDDESGDVIVPIKARLPVSEAALFAVTVEKPGGVVVSKRERIVVTAKPSA